MGVPVYIDDEMVHGFQLCKIEKLAWLIATEIVKTLGCWVLNTLPVPDVLLLFLFWGKCGTLLPHFPYLWDFDKIV